ncbi:hypothetical protein ACFYZE_35100 [Streptomyces sp. NPDC001796]|uniref:hypothetical protein n=1 Tax=Streptomyces sp. NPDC001796 TaxID=3364609 RepID=UPI003675BD08
MFIEKEVRAILTNGRRGPEALVLEGTPASSSSSPTAPWSSFSVATYLDVNYPTQTHKHYEFAIKGFFRVHPLFVVKAFDRHERAFFFPAAHCDEDDEDGDRRDRGDYRDRRGHRGVGGNGDEGDNRDGRDHSRPHGGATADGSDSSGYPPPRKGDDHRNGQGEQKPLTPGGAVRPAPPDAATAGWSTCLLSATHIVIAGGALLMILGMLAVAWLRRHRSAP